MPAEAAPAGLDDEARRPLPHLTPVLVVDDGEAEQLFRAARAGLAMLSLQLRSLPTPEPVGPAEGDPTDPGPAEVLLRTSLEQSVEGRRIELRDELEQVRADAAAHVAAARHEAASIVAGATEATLQVLLGGARPATPAPTLRVVTDEPPRRSPLQTLAEAEPAESSLPETEAPRAPAERARAAHPASNLGGAALEGSVTRAVSAALAEVFAAGQAALAPPTASSPAPLPTAAPTAPVPAVPSPAAEPVPAATTAAAPRSGLRRFLYADVLLPMVAVLIVLVILLAWVG